MAVSRTGSVIDIDMSGNYSDSQTAPSDADMIVVAVSYYGNVGMGISSITWAGQALTVHEEQSGNGSYGYTTIASYASASLSTGSQTLAVNWDSAFSEGGTAEVAFYKGVDTTTSVGDTGGEQAGSSSSTGSLSSDDGDMFVGAAYYYFAGVTWTNATTPGEAAERVYNAAGISYVEHLTGGTDQAYSADGEYSSVVGIIIKAAAAGGAEVTKAGSMRQSGAASRLLAMNRETAGNI